MARNFHEGDYVRLNGVPEWLIHDLPEDEKKQIIECIGSVTMIERVDAYGYIWLCFGNTIEKEDTVYYAGHSFCVPAEYLEPV